MVNISNRQKKELERFLKKVAKQEQVPLPDLKVGDFGSAAEGNLFSQKKTIYLNVYDVLDSSSLQEAKAVIIHELAHLKYKHCEISELFNCYFKAHCFFCVAFVMSFLFDFYFPVVKTLLILFHPLYLLSFLPLWLIFNYLSELQADAFSKKYELAESLSQNLEKTEYFKTNDLNYWLSGTHPPTIIRCWLLSKGLKWKIPSISFIKD